MSYTGRRPGLVFALALALVLAAALAPAGLRAQTIPRGAWLVWAIALASALWMFHQAGYMIREAMRRIGWLVPVVLVLALPAALLVPSGDRAAVALALCARALSAAAVGAALSAWLGPSGLVRGTRQLGSPERLADVFEATLASLTIVLRQVKAMLRAREARRTGFGAWSDLASGPADTVRGFGRLVASLLLRSLERAEALEQARRARGVGP